MVTGVLTLTAPIWIPVSMGYDLVRVKWRLPVVRLLLVLLCWCWIELAGVGRSVWLWLTGQAGDHAANYRLMGWWSGALMGVLRRLLGIDPSIEHPEAFADGNAVVLLRHVSFADSLLSGWVFSNQYPLQPRYVLKKELLVDPCLDIVGNRVPNYFLDRDAVDARAELDALTSLARTIGPGSVGVIFAEGTRANTTKRQRSLQAISERDVARARRLAPLQHLLPPRPAGAAALLEGAPEADVVLVWHVGFDGLDSFRGMIDAVGTSLPPVRFVARRVPRSEVPTGDDFVTWLDTQWLALDREVDAALGAAGAR
jgi:1-acyl-sn-glycerol-3-phosphate acyltransferase